MNKTNTAPAYLFEVSWETCNKVGGIHTVVSTKVLSLSSEFKNNHILIGPDVWKDGKNNPEFTEDPHLFRSWRQSAEQEGLKIRIGRWNIAGNPVAILVDYMPLLSEKDDLLKMMWDRFGVDSITGQWDYIEPVLFGIAAGKVIESHTRYYLRRRSGVVAQFHEWMTGSGLLYLKKKMPHIACVFTTHATVLGRCIAGNGLPLYGNPGMYNPEKTAQDFNVTAKHSLECRSAEFADTFTTVSEITAVECEHFLDKKPDIITPNGFEDSFTPSPEDYGRKKNNGRNKLLTVAEAVLGRKVDENAFITGISGRYEFKNKGIDVFIEGLGKINREKTAGREILAYIFVPAGHNGPDRRVLDNLEKIHDAHKDCSGILTHYLSDPQNDPVLNAAKRNGLENRVTDSVKLFFVPCYLNGNDGIFNMPYYDLLMGTDLTVFPSFYEPWGYTPLESLAFGIPTVTTTLAGFGLWVRNRYTGEHPGIQIIERGDNDSDTTAASVAESICSYARMTGNEYRKACANAREVSGCALWKNFCGYYMQAYRNACAKAEERYMDIPDDDDACTYCLEDRKVLTTYPNWYSVIIHRSIPEKLKALDTISGNLWWSWNEEAVELFRSIDPVLWNECGENPIDLLDRISLQRYMELENDEDFVRRLEDVHSRFRSYMEEKGKASGPSIAYFSMEYGLHSSLKIYSGGLGILAGDYLKEASDKNTDITAVGLLYRYGYFTQKLSAAGNQEAEYEAQDFTKIPVAPARDGDGNWIKVTVDLPGRTLNARVWLVKVGRVELYLLDTDYEDNSEADRSITHHLYGGDWENRLKQEMLLGIGGIRALRKLGKDADVYHCNEGHAAFLGIERLSEYISSGKLGFPEALETVKASSLFTTHTPVPAGHDAFPEDMMRRYFWHTHERMKINWDQFMGLGRINAGDKGEKFSMSYLAANLCQEINGVSWLHGKVSREIFSGMWPGYFPEELHISYVTNGVHYPTWTAPEWKCIHHRVFGEAFRTHHYDRRCFEGIYSVSDEEIFCVRKTLRSKLVSFIKERLSDPDYNACYTPKQIVEIKEKLRDDILTIGFARRFATYKRAHLLFNNLDRLDEIVNNPDRPVQFIFAGKAHPADKAGQDLIRKIVEISKYPQFLGKIIFLQNYDMKLARYLVQGVDVWMNMPTRPLEASGTSGEKAAMNGVMHFSVLDGWWVEGYRPDSGWALPMERTYENQEYQNELDAETVYNMIESDIAPVFYRRDGSGISKEWNMFIRNTIAKVASNFTTNRMLTDYEEKFYIPMSRRVRHLKENNHALAKEISEWKTKVTREWNEIHTDLLVMPDFNKQEIVLGKTHSARLVLDIGELSIDDLGVEMVAVKSEKGKDTIFATHEFSPVKCENGKATYTLEFTPCNQGQFKIALRVYPKNNSLPHRQDFALVKWI